MKNHTLAQEVELKLPLVDKKTTLQKLHDLKAVFISEVKQRDYLYNSSFYSFVERDEALRLRHELSGSNEKVYVTYKGPATFSPTGHKIRDEYEVTVSDFIIMKQILEALQFEKAAIVEKVRATYQLDGIMVAIDTLPFGEFIELEGDAQKSERVRHQLGLSTVEPIKKGYIVLQKEWERKNN